MGWARCRFTFVRTQESSRNAGTRIFFVLFFYVVACALLEKVHIIFIVKYLKVLSSEMDPAESRLILY